MVRHPGHGGLLSRPARYTGRTALAPPPYLPPSRNPTQPHTARYTPVRAPAAAAAARHHRHRPPAASSGPAPAPAQLSEHIAEICLRTDPALGYSVCGDT